MSSRLRDRAALLADLALVICPRCAVSDGCRWQQNATRYCSDLALNTRCVCRPQHDKRVGSVEPPEFAGKRVVVTARCDDLVLVSRPHLALRGGDGVSGERFQPDDGW